MKLHPRNNEPYAVRRSPCGERGLKSVVDKFIRLLFASLPVRGAWVEMESHCISVPQYGQVAPRAGSVG